jgi:hypothetical protein
MAEFKLISEIERKPAEALLAGLNSTDAVEGTQASKKLLAEACAFGLSLKDYLRAAIQPEEGTKLNGYESALKFMRLPVKDDVDSNMSIACASDVFQTQTGSRLLFPEVVLDMVKWKNPIDNMVTVEPLISQTRTIAGANEMIMTFLDGHETDAFNMFQIAEGGEIPIRKIKSTSQSVKFFKIGQGYEITYEFARRVNIDILTPYVNRINRQFEIDKVRFATSLLVNGDGVAGAITVDPETDFGGTNATLDFKSLFKWLVSRAVAGYPVDTLVGNYTTYAEFMFLFTPTTGSTSTAEHIGALGGPKIIPGLSFMNYNIAFAVSNSVAASTLIGLTKGETLEELREANSDIVENERNITNQTIRFVRSQNIGYNLVTPLARRGFSYAA